MHDKIFISIINYAALSFGIIVFFMSVKRINMSLLNYKSYLIKKISKDLIANV